MKSNCSTQWQLQLTLPEYKLYRGLVGTVLEILKDGAAYEVEFCDRNGRTYESISLSLDQIMGLHYEPISTESMPVT